jgi:hypothetical protein
MAKRIRAHLSFANSISLIALFVALGGTSYALATGSVDSREIKNNAVRSADVRNASLTQRDVKRRSLGLARLNIPGVVLLFESASCPSGWTELPAAAGRYLVARPTGGVVGGTAGAALTNLENRAVGRHAHGVSDPTHLHPYSNEWGFSDTADSGLTRRPLFDFKPDDPLNPDVAALGAGATGVEVDPAGAVGGTNAPYIQLLACRR